MPRNLFTTGLLDHRRLVRDEEEEDAWLEVGSLSKAKSPSEVILRSLGPWVLVGGHVPGHRDSQTDSPRIGLSMFVGCEGVTRLSLG